MHRKQLAEMDAFAVLPSILTGLGLLSWQPRGAGGLSDAFIPSRKTNVDALAAAEGGVRTADAADRCRPWSVRAGRAGQALLVGARSTCDSGLLTPPA